MKVACPIRLLTLPGILALALLALFVSTSTAVQASTDFDGQSVYVKHVTSQSTACMEVKDSTVFNLQRVLVADCNDLTAQKWTIEKRTAGDYKDSYRLVSHLSGATHCLDNNGVFATSLMYVSSCVSDTHADVANQSVTFSAHGSGYTVTFTNGAASVWLNTSRIPHIASGAVSQIPVSDTMGTGAVWQFAAVPTPPATDDDDDTSSFDGQTLYVWHETDDSEGCLDVKYGNRSNGQDVWTWECNKTDAQKWIFQKRTAGDYAGSYRLVSALGNDTHCLDNRGDFTTGDRMGIWSCVGDTHGAAPNQSVTIAESGEGYTLTFVRNSDSKSVWLVTDRTSTNPKGGANQTTVSGTVPDSAVWVISATAPAETPVQQTPANNPPVVVVTPEPVSQIQQSENSDNSDNDDPPPPPQPQNVDTDTDPYDGKTFFLRHPAGSAVDCLEVANSNPATQLETGECDYNDNEKWVLQKRTSGEWAGSYRMVHKPTIGSNRVLCAVMSADYTSIDTNVKLGRCRGDNDGRADYQSFTVENVAGGYAIRFATDHPYMHFYYTRLGVTKDDDNNDDVATIPAGTARNGIVAPTAAVTWELLQGEPAADFDDQIVQIYQVDGTSTACLSAVKRSYQSFTMVNEHRLEVAECSDSAFQQWRLEKMTSGAYLIRTMASGQHRCLDNHSHFETNSDLKAGRCAVNSNYKPSVNTDRYHWYNPVVDQSVTITAEGDGYTLKFDNGTKSSWITTDRAAGSTSGSAEQTSTADTVPASAVWGIGTVDDRKALRTNPTLVKPVDEFHDKTFRIKYRYKSGDSGGWISSCLHPYDGQNSYNVQSGDDIILAGANGGCHDSNESPYDADSAIASWKIERRASGDFAGYYRLVSQLGNKDLCLDVDVADTIDGGLEFTTTPSTARSGIYVDTCVGDDHADVASQSVKITRHNDGDGAWGKDSYILTFVEDTSDDAREAWLAMIDWIGDVGQRVVTDDVHIDAIFYLEEQVHAIPDRP